MGRALRETSRRGQFHKIERVCGKFVRRFALSSEADASGPGEDFKEGVLNVHLRKSADGKPKAISVKVA